MKRFLLTILCLFGIMFSVIAQNKIGMLVPESRTTAEGKAVTWFNSTYGSDGEVIGVSALTGSLKATYDVIWVMNDGAATITLSDGQKTALSNFVKAGGNLLLTNMATELVSQIGRIDSKYNNLATGNGNVSGTFGINPVIGTGGNVYDHSTDEIYAGMTSGTTYGYSYNIIPLSNSLTNAKFWDVNIGGYGLPDTPTKIKAFEDETTSEVLGTWQHVTDYCCACVVRFKPTTEYHGTILALGMVSYNWSDDTFIENIKKLTSNMISSLTPTPTPDPDPDPTPSGGDIAMLKITDGISDSETTAQAWFSSNSKGDIITSFDNLDSYKTLWIHIDRVNLALKDIPLSSEQIATLATWVKRGGNLLLSAHATKLVSMMGRISEFNISLADNRVAPTYGYMPGEYGNSDGGHNGDTWGVETLDKKDHPIYNTPNDLTPGDNHWFALIGSGFKQNHNSMWHDDVVSNFERNNHATVIGTWDNNSNFNNAAIVEFTPTQIWKGDILACGIGAYDWHPNSVKDANFNQFTDNMLTYVNQCTLSQFDAYPTGYNAQGVREGSIDDAIFKINETTKKAYLYDANRDKMFIRRIPRFIRIGGQEYEVIGIDPRMSEIPLKFVDLDQGGEEGYRYNVWFDADIALNPHTYFGSHVIVYVLDRDFKVNKKQNEAYAFVGESTNEGTRTNVCIDNRVDHLNMEDEHPLMFPGKDEDIRDGGGNIIYPVGHAFHAKRITFTRQFPVGTTSTIVLPFSLTEAEADAFGTFYDFANYADGTLNFQKHSGPTVARVPYIFVPKVDRMPELNYADWNNAKYVERTCDSNAHEFDHSINHGGYEFHGSFEFLKVYGQHYYPDSEKGRQAYWEYATMYGTEDGDNSQSAQDLGIYAYNNGKFQTSSKWIGMRTFRCYIKLNQPSGGAKAASILASFADDTPASINLIDDEPKADGVIYNMMGQRIPSAQRGLYIVNGKKYFKK